MIVSKQDINSLYVFLTTCVLNFSILLLISGFATRLAGSGQEMTTAGASNSAAMCLMVTHKKLTFHLYLNLSFSVSFPSNRSEYLTCWKKKRRQPKLKIIKLK